MPSNIPTMRSLMDDPLYRAYMKTVPRLPQALTSANPWRLWVSTDSGRWLTREYASYREVWPVFIGRFKNHDQDPTIVSKRVFYAPPGEWYRVRVKRVRLTPSGETHKIEWRWRQKFFWHEVDLHWCGRCRRPVFWAPLFQSHHALRSFPAVTTEDNYRCLICGIRWTATPSVDQMTKVEAQPK